MNDSSPSTETFKAAPEVTITLDIASLLTASKLIGEDYDGDPIYSKPFVDQLVKTTAEKVAKDVLRDELRKQISAQIEQQVHDGIAAALDAPVQTTNTWGEPIGKSKTLRQALADKAAEEVSQWMKTDSYGSGKFKNFLSQQVDAAVRADLNNTLKQARETTVRRMQETAAQAIADAAKSAVTAMGR